MAVEITEEALTVLSRSLELGKVDRAGGGVRLRWASTLGGGSEIQVELASGPADGDTTIRAGGVNVFVDPAITRSMPDALVTVEPEHERIVVRARGSKDVGP